jgi:hypothetical protein
MAIGARGSGPARALSIRAASATVRAIGHQPVLYGQVGTRPGDGRSPTTLQKLAGFRSEPPMSLPSASGTIPRARATAAPPLLPPHVLRSRDHVEVRYAREQPLSAAEEHAGGERIHQALGHTFRLTFTRQDTIARQPNGKYETFFTDIPGPPGSPGGTPP